MEIDKEMLEKVVQTGRQAALAAGAVLRQNYSKPHQITMKGAIDPVTESDLQSQEMIIALIRQSFPDHGILAEETPGEEAAAHGGSRLRQNRRLAAGSSTLWTAPSTSPTAIRPSASPSPSRRRGGWNTAWSTTLCGMSFLRPGGGRGPVLNGQPIQVSTIDRLERALVATGFPYDIRERLPETLARLGRIMGIGPGAAPGRVRRPGPVLRGLRPLRRLL